MSEYTDQANDFLAKFGIKFKATRAKVQSPPPWADESDLRRGYGTKYNVTFSNAAGDRKVSFPFWDSIVAKEKGEALEAYSVLACISGDIPTALIPSRTSATTTATAMTRSVLSPLSNAASN